MCFVIDRDSPDPIIAQEDVLCYKILERHGDKILSPFQYTPYEIGETKPHVHLLTEWSDQGIEQGYHSYTHIKEKVSVMYERPILVECVIPKGSTYYKNKYDGGEYVSSSIRTVKIIREY